MLVFILLITAGCVNAELDSSTAENEELANEISHLKELVAEKEKEISYLEEVYSKKINELAAATKTIEMVRWSAIARLVDYEKSFYALEDIYKIHSDHEVKNDWYEIKNNYFEIELLGYENAKKVDFYTLRLESGEGINLLFSDTDPEDGWVYTNVKISEIINKHEFHKNYSIVPYFVLYTEVTLEDGSVVRTSNLPIYYPSSSD